MFHMTNIYLGIDFHTAMMYRVYQSIGMAFLFVPINTLCYIGVPQEQNNQISSMINLMRNLGGSFGISFVTTMLARRAQVHQTDPCRPHRQLQPDADLASRHAPPRMRCAAAPAQRRCNRPTPASTESCSNRPPCSATETPFWPWRFITVLVMPLVLLARRPKPGEVRLGH